MKASETLEAFLKQYAVRVETPEFRQQEEFKHGVGHNGEKHPSSMPKVSRRQPQSAPPENSTTKTPVLTPSPHSSDGFMESPDTFLQGETQPLPTNLIQNRLPASVVGPVHQYTAPPLPTNDFQPQVYQMPVNSIQMYYSHVYQMQLNQMAIHQTQMNNLQMHNDTQMNNMQTGNDMRVNNMRMNSAIQVNDMQMNMNLQTFGGVQIGPQPSKYEVSNVEDTSPWLLEDDDQVLINLARDLFP